MNTPIKREERYSSSNLPFI